MNIKELINAWWNTLEYCLSDDEFENAIKDKKLILEYIEKLEEFASIVKEFITIEKLDGYDGDFITQNYSSSRRLPKEKADLVKEVLENE